MLQRVLWGLLLVLLGLSFNSYAEKTVALYEVDSLVINQSTPVRQRAAAEGLKTVLVRLTGDSDIASQPVFANAFANASDYLDTYRYQSTTETLMIAGSPQAATLLRMRFNRAAVEDKVEQAGLPLWSATRPDVLIWAADDQRGKQYIDLGSTFATSLNRAASQRGLPLTIPVFDLEDRSALPLNRLWALDEIQTKVASQRYATNAVLLGRFSLLKKEWNASFVLNHRQKTLYLSAKGDTESAVSQAIIDQVADYFADLYAVAAKSHTSLQALPNQSAFVTGTISNRTDRFQGPGGLLIEVGNIDSFAAYASLMNYLENLPAIESVSIITANQPSLLLGLRLKGSSEQLLSSLSLDNKLMPLSPSTAAASASRPLEFLWRKN